METRKIDNLIVKGVENLDYLKYFAPQVILPEKTADFFLLHNHHLVSARELKIIAITSIGGKVEELSRVEPHLEELTRRAGYGWSDLLGNFLRRLYFYFQDVAREVSMLQGSEEEIQIKAGRMFTEKMRKHPEIVLDLFTGLPLPFIQLLQISLAGYISKYILDKTRRLVEAVGLSTSADSFRLIDEMTLTLYISRVIFPIISTSVCTNRTEPHYDFLLSSIPLRGEKCRVCECPAITFSLYLITEPYASFKTDHRDLSYVISSYISTKSAGEIECFPKVFVKKDSKEEEVDVLIRNWTTGDLAIAECKVKENPKATYDTKVNMVRQDLEQLVRKVNTIKSDFGYLITNLIFESDEERKRILEDASKKMNTSLPSNIKLLGKIQGRNIISEWDSILSDIKRKYFPQKEDSIASS